MRGDIKYPPSHCRATLAVQSRLYRRCVTPTGLSRCRRRPDLLDVFYGHVRSGFVFNKDVSPSARVLLVIRSFRQPNLVVAEPFCSHVTVLRGYSSWTRWPFWS